MEQRKPHAHYDEFGKQFVSLLHEHWSDIVRIIHRQSPRVAATLRVATPLGLKRVNGIWRVQVMMKRTPEKLHQPKDNEIVAQSIRLWAHSAAQLRLPRVMVDFEL